VTMLEPDHVGALALTGEIYIMEKRFNEAAEALSRLARLGEAPTQQRLMSGIAAVDLYENRLGQRDRALEVLVTLHRSGLSTLPVRERLARASARAEAWDTATSVLEELMQQRDTREGRIEAARLAMVLYRDKLAARVQQQVRHAVDVVVVQPEDAEADGLRSCAGHILAPYKRYLPEYPGPRTTARPGPPTPCEGRGTPQCAGTSSAATVRTGIRGISGVELNIDGAGWQSAQLKEAVSAVQMAWPDGCRPFGLRSATSPVG